MTAEGLESKGVKVVYFNPWKNQLKGVDICHCWGIDPQMIYFVRQAKRYNIPVVISPVFMRFSEPTWLVALEYKLGRYIRGLFTPQGIIYQIFESCDKVIALNSEERSALERVFKLSREKTVIIPNGIEKKFANGDPRIFEERYGIRNFVLQVGYIERRKNLLTTIRAIRGLPYNLVVIGGWEMREEEYVLQCKKEAGDNVLFIGHIDHDDPLLASAYAAAKVFVLPSINEVMPLVVYEAAQAGCQIVLSNTFPCSKVIRDYVFFASPSKPSDLRRQIIRAMESPRNEQLKRKALEMPTWQEIADLILDVYKLLIKAL